MIRRISLLFAGMLLLHATTSICMEEAPRPTAKKSEHWYTPVMAKVTTAGSIVHKFCFGTPRRKAATFIVLGAVIGVTAWLTKGSWLPVFYRKPVRVMPFLTGSEVTELMAPQPWSMFWHPGKWLEFSWMRVLSQGMLHA